MYELVNTISAPEWLRIFVVYSHIIVAAFALTAVLRADIKMVISRISSREIEKDSKRIFLLLVALWVTGLTVVYFDTGFNPDVLMDKSKLLLKLICVLVLTANGLILHYISFPILERDTVTVSYAEAALLSVTGALSTSHWLLAAFVGKTASLSQVSFQALLETYAIFLCVTLVVSLCFILGIHRIKVGISGRRVTDPPAARRKKLLHELIATPRVTKVDVNDLEEASNRASDKEEHGVKKSIFSKRNAG